MIDITRIGIDRVRLIVQGNQAMSWRANVLLALSLGVVTMSVALVMAWQGLWLVIPFAGLEFLAVLGGLYMTLRRLERREVITVDTDAVQLEWGRRAPERSVRLPRQWARLRYHCKESPFDTGRLSMCAHGRRYALGDALGRVEKRELYRELDAVLQGSFDSCRHATC